MPAFARERNKSQPHTTQNIARASSIVPVSAYQLQPALQLQRRPMNRTELASPVAPEPQFDFARISVMPPLSPSEANRDSPGAALEREADHMADTVMRPVDATINQPPLAGGFKSASAEEGKTTRRDPALLPQAGAPLSRDLRSYFEPRFGYDFSQVRVHSGSEAADRARAMKARAYTVGRDIVLGAGEYTPATAAGRRLLAHELAHVIQQSESQAETIQRKAWVGSQALTVDEAYKTTVRKTWGDKAVARLVELHTDGFEHRFANWGELVAEYENAKNRADTATAPAPEKKEDDVCESLPGFGQRGPTCAAASLITPVLIWDNEQYSNTDPNARLRNLILKMKTYMQANQQTLKPRFDSGRNKTVFENSIGWLDQLDTDASDKDFKLHSEQYQAMAQILMYMSQDKLSSGLNEQEMQKARQALGFSAKSTNVRFFESLFQSDGDLANMKPGHIAQVTWFVRDAQQSSDPSQLRPKYPTHAFTIGRLSNGTWILNDQGYTKALCLKGPDLASLKDAMLEAADQGKWWGVTDADPHEPEAGVQTGYTVLGDETTLMP